MKCQVCKTSEARKNIVTCSERCSEIRLIIIRMLEKYTPCNGCDNCLGDLYGTCSDKCKDEFRASREFAKEIWRLIKLAMEDGRRT